MNTFWHRTLARAPVLLVLGGAALLPPGTAGGTPGAPGNQLWEARYNAPASLNDGAQAMAVSGSTVFVTGTSEVGPAITTDYITIAYDSTGGGTLWGKRYNGPAASYDSARAIAITPDGSKVFVTGGSNDGTGSPDYATIAYAAGSGATLWGKRYNGPAGSGDTAYALAVSPDGSRVFVTGFSNGVSSDVDYATIAYDTTTGALVWGKRYNGPGNGSDLAQSIAVSPDGSKVFVTGGSAGISTSSDYATIAYDSATGALLWRKRYNGIGSSGDTASSVGVSPDGSKVFVTGYSYGGGTVGDDYATVAYDATTGTPAWVKRYNGPGNGSDLAYSLALSPDSSKVFVTGYSFGVSTSTDAATIAYNTSTGALAWGVRFDGADSGPDYGYSVTVSPDSSEVYVAGSTYSSITFDDYATLAYNSSTGAPLWSSFYDGTGAYVDGAHAVNASPDGSKVFVTGSSYGSSLTYDYETIAYET